MPHAQLVEKLVITLEVLNLQVRFPYCQAKKRFFLLPFFQGTACWRVKVPRETIVP